MARYLTEQGEHTALYELNGKLQVPAVLCTVKQKIIYVPTQAR